MASSSSIRSFGSLICRFSNGVFLRPSHSFALQRKLFFSEKLSSCSRYSSSGKWVSAFHFGTGNSVRKIRTFAPLFMGRRSCKIAGRKTAQDAKKTKLYSRIGKEVVSAVKKGGPNPVSNIVLAALLEKAKEFDVPKEILERNIKRASEKGQEAYIEKTYEVYGYGGAGIVVEVLTDKINRSVAAIRGVLKDCGGKMADSGSIAFKFKRARVVNIKVVMITCNVCSNRKKEKMVCVRVSNREERERETTISCVIRKNSEISLSTFGINLIALYLMQHLEEVL
nr:probable transcriptional regulatory protein At2g25830 isoform X2 [Coffea arabica]